MTTEGQGMLRVVIEGRQVGHIDADAHGQMAFTYASAWLAAPDRFAISVSLPLTPRRDASPRAHRFFANLLPEGSVRERLTRRLGLSTDNDFALLRAVGRDCAGALSIVPDELDELEDGDNLTWRRLDDELLAELSTRESVLSTLTGQGHVRLSLAGAQDKLPVCVVDGRIMLPEGSTPSTHILKFPGRLFAHLPANEVLITWLASALALPVIEIELLEVGGHWISCATRYDRHEDDTGRVRRLHQEDACQALGVSHRRKYELEGGPGFAEVYALVRGHVANPLTDNRTLLRWLVFCVLVGNADAHAKNISLLAGPQGLTLAPLYDIVCTRAYPGVSRDLAMGIGGVHDLGQIRGRNWRELAFDLRVRERLVLDLVAAMADEIDTALEQVVTRFEARYGAHPVLQLVPNEVRRQVRRIRTLLAE